MHRCDGVQRVQLVQHRNRNQAPLLASLGQGSSSVACPCLTSLSWLYVAFCWKPTAGLLVDPEHFFEMLLECICSVSSSTHRLSKLCMRQSVAAMQQVDADTVHCLPFCASACMTILHLLTCNTMVLSSRSHRTANYHWFNHMTHRQNMHAGQTFETIIAIAEQGLHRILSC